MLRDKVIVIVGGAGLIGQEFVAAIIEQNGIAIIADINEEVGAQVQTHLSNELGSSNIDFLPLDITSKESITKMIDVLHRRYGRIDGL